LVATADDPPLVGVDVAEAPPAMTEKSGALDAPAPGIDGKIPNPVATRTAAITRLRLNLPDTDRDPPIPPCASSLAMVARAKSRTTN